MVRLGATQNWQISFAVLTLPLQISGFPFSVYFFGLFILHDLSFLLLPLGEIVPLFVLTFSL